MFWTILLTLIICSLLFMVYAEYMARIRVERKCSELRSENKDLRARNAQYHDWEVKRLCRDNYRKGLEDGSKCDTLYKSIVSKYKAHEQVTIMMYGEKGGNEQ